MKKVVLGFFASILFIPILSITVVVGAIGGGSSSDTNINVDYTDPNFIIYDDSNLNSRVPLLVFPTDSTVVNSPYGNRYDPFTGAWVLHDGVDLTCPLNAPTYAVASGKVVEEGKDYYGANFVIIEHAVGIRTYYWHHERNLVKNGDKVNQGQKIALCGSTGYSTGAHQHFMLSIDGVKKNALPYLLYGRKQKESK